MKRAALGLLALVTLFPLYWMAVTALSPAGQIFARTLHLYPSRAAWENFARVWSLYPYGRWALNSAVVTLAGATLSTLLSVMAGYAFAKHAFRGSLLVFAALICTMMLPEQVLLIPQFLLAAKLHGVDSWWALILPGAAQAFGVFVARQSLAGFPDELLEAARLDGADEWTIFWRIVLPLSKPLLAVLFLFAVLDRWNDFAWPLVILQDQDALTLPVGLSRLFGEHATDWAAIMAVSIATVVPILLLFAFLQRYLVRGIAREGIK